MHIKINWADISVVQSTPKMNQLLKRVELFEDKLGTVKYFTAHLEFKESCTPKFFVLAQCHSLFVRQLKLN